MANRTRLICEMFAHVILSGRFSVLLIVAVSFAFLLSCHKETEDQFNASSTKTDSDPMQKSDSISPDDLKNLYSSPSVSTQPLVMKWTDHTEDGVPSVTLNDVTDALSQVIGDTDEIISISFRIWKLKKEDSKKIPENLRECGISEVPVYSVSAVTSLTVTNKKELFRFIDKLNIKPPFYLDMVSISFKQ